MNLNKHIFDCYSDETYFYRREGPINQELPDLPLIETFEDWGTDLLLTAADLLFLVSIEKGGGDNFLKCKPDFATRGRLLNEHYIKSEDVIAKVVQGLKEVGIDVARLAMCIGAKLRELFPHTDRL